MRKIRVGEALHTLDDLITNARACCAVRDLTPEERQLFSLPSD